MPKTKLSTDNDKDITVKKETKLSTDNDKDITVKKETKLSPYKTYGVYKIEKAGFKDNKPIFKTAEKPLKTIKLLQEQADELNVHKENTLIEYKEI